MANMSYCRFENTSNDLGDCINAMEEAVDIPHMDLSQYEMAAFKRMAVQCQEFLDHYERLEDATTYVRDKT